MSVINFATDKVTPNPFQTRFTEDADHVRELAISIGKHGIIQTPLGRMSTTQQGQPEIAFGHNRLSAKKLLVSSTPEELEALGFTFTTPEELHQFKEKHSKIDIDIQTLSDLELFEMAVIENHDRQELTPIEEAQAMVTYRDKFGKNSDEVGLLFHLSGSAVRNKMRLLDLPEEYRPLIGAGMGEGVAREILAYEALPSKIKTTQIWNRRTGESDVLKEAIKKSVVANAPLEDIKKQIDDAVSRASTRLDSKPFKHDEVLMDVENKSLPICKGCPSYLMRNKQELCLNEECFRAKVISWKTNYLLQASLVSGLPVLEHTDGEFKQHTNFSWSHEHNLSTILSGGGCQNLRLVYDEIRKYGPEGKQDYSESDKITHLIKLNYPHAKVVCMKREGSCTCVKAISTGVTESENTGEPKTEADLKAIRQTIATQKRINDEKITQLVSETSSLIQAGLEANNALTFKYVFCNASGAGFNSYQDEVKNATDLQTVFKLVCDKLAEHQSTRQSNNPTYTLNGLNGVLRECGLQKLEDQAGNSQTEVSTKQGKPLMEMFGVEMDDPEKEEIRKNSFALKMQEEGLAFSEEEGWHFPDFTGKTPQDEYDSSLEPKYVPVEESLGETEF